MKHLGYCIFPDVDWSSEAPPVGAEGRAVSIVAAEGLAAAVSQIGEAELDPEVGRVLAYENVVEWFHRRQTVLPLRFGSLFDDCRQLQDLLRERAIEFSALLAAVDGMVELSVRLLPAWPELPANSSGAAYLADRRARIARTARLFDQVCLSLAGLYTQKHSEPGEAGSLPVAYFLVARDRIEGFREALRGAGRTLPAKLLLSGPWPPYNFVGPTGLSRL